MNTAFKGYKKSKTQWGGQPAHTKNEGPAEWPAGPEKKRGETKLLPGQSGSWHGMAWEALAASVQARPWTSGSRLALYNVHVNTAGLRASAAMGLSGRLRCFFG